MITRERFPKSQVIQRYVLQICKAADAAEQHLHNSKIFQNRFIVPTFQDHPIPPLQPRDIC